MNTWKIVCATLVIFIAGIVTGVVLMRLGERGPRPWVRMNREIPRPAMNDTNLDLPDAPPGPRGVPDRGGPPAASRDREFLQMLDRQITLTPEQRGRIVQIMSEGQERIRQLRQSIDPDIRREMEKTHEQIQALLNPEQRERFQQLMKQRIQRRVESMNPERRLGDWRENRRNIPLRERPNDGALPPLPPPPHESQEPIP